MHTNQVRRVIAKYIEDPDQGSSYDTREKPWMEYQKDQNKPPIKSDLAILKGIKPESSPSDTPGLDIHKEPNVTYNPYDYKDPSSKPKNTEDSDPLVVDIPSNSGPFFVTRPSLFKEEGPLHEWAKSRRRDWTSDPTQQSPAISIDRRFASEKSIKNVLGLYLLSAIPVRTSIPMIESPVIMKTAASLLGINSAFKSGDPSMYAKTFDRARAVGAVSWTNQSDADALRRGLYQLRVPSSSGGGNYDVYLQFLRTKDKRPTPNGFLDFDVQVSCSCKSFLYFGAQYYAVNDKYMYMPGFRPSLVPPHSRDEIVSKTRMPDGGIRENPGKGLNFRMCKHLIKAMDFVRNNLTAKEVNVTKNYPLIGRPSTLINTKKWEDFFKFPFTKDDVQKFLINPSNLKKRPSIYFTVYTPSQNHYDEVDNWVESSFKDLSKGEKDSYLRFLSEHPEEIFYVLWSYAKLIHPDKIDASLISSAYDYMSKTVVPESEEEPESVLKEEPEEKGTGAISPKDFPGKEEMKEIEKEEEKGAIQPLKSKRIEREKKKKIEDEEKERRKKEQEERKQDVLDKSAPEDKTEEEEEDQTEEEEEDRGVRKTDIRNEI